MKIEKQFVAVRETQSNVIAPTTGTAEGAKSKQFSRSQIDSANFLLMTSRGKKIQIQLLRCCSPSDFMGLREFVVH